VKNVSGTVGAQVYGDSECGCLSTREGCGRPWRRW